MAACNDFCCFLAGEDAHRNQPNPVPFEEFVALGLCEEPFVLETVNRNLDRQYAII